MTKTNSLFKQLIFGIFILAATFFSTKMTAQEIADNAIGLRLGSNNGFGAEISYQRILGTKNRLEFSLGWEDDRRFSAIKTIGLYQWIFPIKGDFNWYTGTGAGVGYIDFDDDYLNDRNLRDDGNEVFVVLTGTIGVEYHFDFPLLVSIDLRPEIGLGDYYDDFDFNLGVGVRYKF